MDDQNNDATGDDKTTNEKPNEQLALDDKGGTPNEAEAFRIEILKLKRELQASTKKLNDAEAAKLEASGNFKKLWEEERKQREDLETKLKQNTSAFVETHRRAAAKDALIKAGLRTDAIKLIDSVGVDGLEVEVTDGEFKVLGTETLVSKYRQEFPFMFTSNAPNVNAGTGASKTGQSSGPVSKGDLWAIEKKYGSASSEYRSAVMSLMAQKKQ
jgi:hypothetical protein